MTYLSVKEVADFLQVSQRRVRALCVLGRIRADKDSMNIWRIHIPFRLTEGSRGASLRAAFPV